VKFSKKEKKKEKKKKGKRKNMEDVQEIVAHAIVEALLGSWRYVQPDHYWPRYADAADVNTTRAFLWIQSLSTVSRRWHRHVCSWIPAATQRLHCPPQNDRRHYFFHDEEAIFCRDDYEEVVQHKCCLRCIGAYRVYKSSFCHIECYTSILTSPFGSDDEKHACLWYEMLEVEMMGRGATLFNTQSAKMFTEQLKLVIDKNLVKCAELFIPAGYDRMQSQPSDMYGERETTPQLAMEPVYAEALAYAAKRDALEIFLLIWTRYYESAPSRAVVEEAWLNAIRHCSRRVLDWMKPQQSSLLRNTPAHVLRDAFLPSDNNGNALCTMKKTEQWKQEIVQEFLAVTVPVVDALCRCLNDDSIMVLGKRTASLQTANDDNGDAN
jgi:hypothetical protein